MPPVLAPEVAEQETPQGLSLLAAGDNMAHLSIIRWCGRNGSYDFRSLYEPLRELLAQTDLAFVNQEAPLVADSAPSGYPRFNAPPEAGLALLEAGFNVVGQANNHILDQGAEGLAATVDFWRGLEGVTLAGVKDSAADQRFELVEAGGYSLAWLAYSYGSNSLPERWEAYQLNLMEREAMAADIEQARAVADGVIVSLHWGEEYQFEPNPEQRDLARFLAGAGALLIIGHHPHVLQPLEWLQGRDGQRTLVAYSLGNLISAQDKRETMLGGLLSVEFAATETGLAIESAGVRPVVTHYERGYTNFAVYPLAGYTEQLARRHYLYGAGQALSLPYLRRLAADVLGEFYMKE